MNMGNSEKYVKYIRFIFGMLLFVIVPIFWKGKFYFSFIVGAILWATCITPSELIKKRYGISGNRLSLILICVLLLSLIIDSFIW